MTNNGKHNTMQKKLKINQHESILKHEVSSCITSGDTLVLLLS